MRTVNTNWLCKGTVEMQVRVLKVTRGWRILQKKKYVHFSDLIICHKRFKYELHQEIQQQTLKRGRIKMSNQPVFWNQ